MEQIVGLVPRLGLRRFLGRDRCFGRFGVGGIGFSGRSVGLGCLRGVLASSRAPAKLFRREVEQIVGLVRRLGRRRLVGQGRCFARLGRRGIGFSGRLFGLEARSVGCGSIGTTPGRCLLIGLADAGRFGICRQTRFLRRRASAALFLFARVSAIFWPI